MDTLSKIVSNSSKPIMAHEVSVGSQNFRQMVAGRTGLLGPTEYLSLSSQGSETP